MKRLHNIVLFCVLFILIAGTRVKAQSNQKSNPQKESADIFVKLGDDIFEFGDVMLALEMYQNALNEYPIHVEANFKAGTCYLNSDRKADGLKYFLKVNELDYKYDSKLAFYIAECYHYGYDFENAIIYYNQYRKTLSKLREQKDIKQDAFEAEWTLLDRKLEECEHGKLLVQHPLEIQIIDLGRSINSKYPDYAPAISGDEKTMVFTSRRRGSTGDLLHVDRMHYEDIYISRKQEDGTWSRAQNMGPEINTPSNDASVSISQRGDELFIYKDDNNGDLFVSELIDDTTWGKPKPLRAVNTGDFEGHITESKEGDFYIFSSDRRGGMGGLDLYYITRDAGGKWGNPVNLGAPVNTQFDENSPFLDANGNLYFSSRGHKTMGGYDIFFAEYDAVNKTWKEPHNVGYPINSPDDDLDFSIPGSGKHGYFASYKYEEKSRGGKDIYMIYMDIHTKEFEEYRAKMLALEEQKKQIQNVEVSPIPVEEHPKAEIKKIKNGVFITGVVTDAETKKGISVNVEVNDVNNGETVASTRSNPDDGSYEVMVPVDGEFIVSAHEKSYLYQSERVSTAGLKKNDRKVSNLESQEVKMNTPVVINHINFNSASSTILRSSYAALNGFISSIWELPICTIEISGHTDSQGPDVYNKDLSLQRAEAVREYLMAHGVTHKIVIKGYGEERPIARNETPEGRAKNRRIEMKIISGLEE